LPRCGVGFEEQAWRTEVLTGRKGNIFLILMVKGRKRGNGLCSLEKATLGVRRSVAILRYWLEEQQRRSKPEIPHILSFLSFHLLTVNSTCRNEAGAREPRRCCKSASWATKQAMKERWPRGKKGGVW
jgi:hypothetical protein